MIARRTLLRFSTGLIFASLTTRGGFAQSASVDKLMEPGPLPEKVFGSETAPVTVIEYASLTCHHCMNFHTKTWPVFKAKYVDTGKVRFIAREFPLDPLAAGGFMLVLLSGLVMFGSQPAELLANRLFIIKLGLVMLAGLNALWFHAREGLQRLDTMARVQTATSLVLWLAVIICGRWLAY